MTSPCSSIQWQKRQKPRAYLMIKPMPLGPARADLTHPLRVGHEDVSGVAVRPRTRQAAFAIFFLSECPS